MICKNCNQEIPDDVAFCPNCGYSLKDPVEEAATDVNENGMGAPEAAEAPSALAAHIAGIPAAVAQALGKVPEEAEAVAEAAADVPEAAEAVEEAAAAAPEAAEAVEEAAAAAPEAAADVPELEWGTPTLDEAEQKAEAYGQGLMDEIPVPEAPEPPRPEGIPEPEPAPEPKADYEAPTQAPVYADNGVIPGKNQAVASLVLGIIGTVGALFLGFGFISIILGVIGVLMGNKAKLEGFETGMQKAGFILSVISVVLGALGVVACIACGAAALGLSALS